MRVVKEEMRMKVAQVSDAMMEIACGLHNLRTALRQPFCKELFCDMLIKDKVYCQHSIQRLKLEL